MKKLILPLLIIATSGLYDIFGQTKFEKIIGSGLDEYGNFRWDVGTSLIKVIDEGYFILGESQGDIYLIKTDLSGDTLWTKLYGDESFQTGCDFLKTDDNGFFIVGTTGEYSNSEQHQIYIIKANHNGDTIWTKTINDFSARFTNYRHPFRRGFSVAQVDNSGYVIAGNIKDTTNGRSDILIFKVDPYGNPEWIKTYGDALFDYANCVESTNDGGYIVAGQYSNSFSGDYNAFLFKLNANGDSLWMRTYLPFTSGHAVIKTNEGGYLLTGYKYDVSLNQDILLIKTNEYGDTSWTKTININNDDAALDVIQQSDKGYLIGGYSNGRFDVRPTSSKMCIVKTDQSGNLGWYRIYDNPGVQLYGDQYCTSLLESNDMGYILLGNIELFVKQGSPWPITQSDIWFISVDKNGCSYPDPVISGNNYFCENDSTFLDAGEGFLTYEWSNGAHTRQIYVKEPDDYFVNTTDSTGCPLYSDTLVIQKIQLPDISILPDGPTTICSGESIDLDAVIHNYDAEKTYSYSWNNDFAVTSSIQVDTSGMYRIRVEDNYECNALDSINVIVRYPYQEEKICIVTVDLNSGKNIIVWEKTPDAGIETYNIYRESDIGKFDKIGSKNAEEMSVFLDETADPESRSYLYKITIIDSCGNESDKNSVPYHWPSFLQYVSSVGGVNLEWTEYRIEGIENIEEYLTSYVIYRGTDSTGLSEYQEVGRQLNFTDKDPDALLRKYYYRVAATFKDPCCPTVTTGKKADSGPYSQSMSNLEDNRFLTSVQDNFLKNSLIQINPNPFNETTTLHFSNPESNHYKLYILDLSGKICGIVDDITANEYVLEKGDLKQGFYYIELRGPNIYRGKVIVE